tara:strand:+ start:70604 stop:70789 length:186 start_codon:yes stop_codon:yes gene_type:complete
MSDKEALEEIRTLISKIDGLASNVLEYLEEMEIDVDELEIFDQMEDLQNNITNYQENKGYI